MNTIYIESGIINHHRTKAFLQKFPQADIIKINKYSDVFNRKNQDFRKQKERGLTYILAEKRDHFVLPVPQCKTLKHPNNFYFSHLYNCPFDCEYCYLQGMYRSAFLVFFANYEDFADEIKKISERGTHTTFFSGYDSDSLALEHLTGFAEYFVPFFETLKNTEMELRTKSVNIKYLENIDAQKNTYLCWTLSPEEITQKYEKKSAPFLERIKAIQTLAQKGWRIQLRFEPILSFKGWKEVYEDFFAQITEHISPEWIERVSIGHLRFPKDIYKIMKKRLPTSKILAEDFELLPGGVVTYPQKREKEMTNFFVSHSQEIFGEKKVRCFSSDLNVNPR